MIIEERCRLVILSGVEIGATENEEGEVMLWCVVRDLVVIDNI